MRRTACIFAAVIVLAGCSPRDEWQSRSRSAPPNPLVQGVIDEINAVRTSPDVYAKRLESRRPFYSDSTLSLPGHPAIETTEGARALDEAVAAVAAKPRMQPLAWSTDLAKIARQMGRTLGPSGLTEDSGQTELNGDVHELLAFGSSEPDSVVARLLIDDGVSSRSDRAVLLDPNMKVAGAACGPHARYKTMCVIEIASEPPSAAH